jgi:phospholipase A1/A2
VKSYAIIFISINFIICLSPAAKTSTPLEPNDKSETFSFRLHRDNYVLIEKYSHDPNLRPYLPYLHIAPGADLTRNEVAFQLSFKVMFFNNILGSPIDLWGGYTQQSFWQAYNGKASRPFRETNYQPELMAVLPIDFSVLGVTARFAGLGLEHQSNGQLALFSRSWNRLYGELGLETGNLALVGRIWMRFGEMADNPDIYNYMGHGHVTATYRWRGHVFAGLFRYNFRYDRGAVQFSWASPIHPHIKGYVQVFSGYGQSLIDYNALQRTIGLGFLVDY